MLRKVTAGVMAALVPTWALGALFVHAHLDDHDTPHHDGHTIHAHLAEQHSPASGHRGATSLDHDDDERALTMTVFVAVSPDVPGTPALPEAPLVLLASWAPAPRPMPQVTHGHDPPIPDRLAPRPPPFPVL